MPRPLFLLVAILALAPVLAPVHAAASFETISDGTTPRVAYMVDHSGSTLTVRVKVGAYRPGQPAPRLQLGLGAAQTAVLDQTRAKIEPGKDGWIYTFTLPNVTFDKPETARFRWALAVEWVGADGRSLQRQNYFTPSSWSPFRDIGRDASAWTVFSLADYRAEQERRAQRIAIDFAQPFDGKASIVIENAEGRRVRNLVTGQPLKAGAHEFVWDGLDEDGLLVSPGDYRWRAISHPGIRPEMQMYFYAPGERPWARHTWLADHSNPVAAAAFGDRVTLGAPVAESGNNIVLTDLDGQVLTTANLSSFIGLGRLFLALGPDRIYALNEGSPGYESVRKDADGNDYVYGELTLVTWDHAGTQQRYKGKNGEHVVIAYKKPLSEGSGWRKDRLKLTLRNLRGAVYLDGRLYLSLHDENRILIIDPADGAEAGDIAVPSPGPIATDGKALYGLSGSHIFRVAAPKPGATAAMLFACKLSAPIKEDSVETEGTPLTATGMAVNAAGEIFLSDNGVDQNIKVYNARGKLLRELGSRGGRASRGAWKADDVRHPHGIAIDSRGRLWLAENEEAPKRISVWDTNTGRVTKEIFGPTPYGGSGAGFDPADATRWFAAGSMWKLDYKTKEAAIQSVLFHRTKPGQLADIVDGHNIRTIHHGDRTFLFAKGRTLQIFELMPDGSARIRAVLGSLSGFQADSPRFSVPAVFKEHPLLKDELTAFVQKSGKFGDYLRNETASKNARDYTVLWTDVNGDEVAQVDEVQVTGKGPRLNIPYWSTLSPGLDLGFIVENEKTWARGTLKLRGFLPSGTPDWSLADAFATAVPLRDYSPGNLQATMMDDRGRILINASPMVGIDPDGSVRWRLRNDWAGVHGSHRAPLPETGVMQGTLGYLGDAPFDEQGEITVLNGNHGRFFALTTDGIYLDEFFDDVRVALERNPNRVGGEAFGGYFSKDAKTGRYILQAGHGAYRIYEMKGMDRLVRSAGELAVNAEQLAAAQKLNEARVARDTVRKETVLRAAAATGAGPADWPGAWTAEWGNATRPFPHARVKALRDGDALVLGYEVKDPTPWLNNGVAQNLLFKTGDAVDFQFSTDASATATRGDAAVGDRRLLIANFQDKPVAILYDYRVPGTESPVLFNSPWRSARVDRVSVVEAADIKVTKTKTGYTVVARIPLAALGLPAEGGKTLLADFGVIYGDEAGESNILRSYWANPSTGLVNDVPGETMINPSLWGVLKTE